MQNIVSAAANPAGYVRPIEPCTECAGLKSAHGSVPPPHPHLVLKGRTLADPGALSYFCSTCRNIQAYKPAAQQPCWL